MTLRLHVLGLPQTQGSKRAFVNRHTQRVVLVEQKGEELRSWREAIAAEARLLAGAHGAPWTGPVAIDLDFCLPKPASAPKRRRTWPIGARSGDVDKLARAVLDALTGVLFLDDSQVVRLTAGKDYGPRPGVEVCVGQLVVDVEEPAA